LTIYDCILAGCAQLRLEESLGLRLGKTAALLRASARKAKPRWVDEVKFVEVANNVPPSAPVSD